MTLPSRPISCAARYFDYALIIALRYKETLKGTMSHVAAGGKSHRYLSKEMLMLVCDFQNGIELHKDVVSQLVPKQVGERISTLG